MNESYQITNPEFFTITVPRHYLLIAATQKIISPNCLLPRFNQRHFAHRGVAELENRPRANKYLKYRTEYPWSISCKGRYADLWLIALTNVCPSDLACFSHREAFIFVADDKSAFASSADVFHWLYMACWSCLYCTARSACLICLVRLAWGAFFFSNFYF